MTTSSLHLAATRKPGRPRDPALRARRTREILDAALAEFAERGFSETDLERVAQRAGVAKATIYRYFPTKNDLFLATVDDGVRQMSDRIDAIREAGGDALEIIRRAIRAYLEFFRQRPGFAELFIQERAFFRDRKRPSYFVHREHRLGPWRELIGALMRSGRLRRSPIERVLNVLGDLLYGTMFANHMSGRRDPVVRQWENIVEVMFRGILSESERRRPLLVKSKSTGRSAARARPGSPSHHARLQ